ncbi:MAG: hypothetical protein GX907_02205 [Clostridiaceae bacterium]|nr:hypothetical protein [Clostridiaceae bacterium]
MEFEAVQRNKPKLKPRNRSGMWVRAFLALVLVLLIAAGLGIILNQRSEAERVAAERKELEQQYDKLIAESRCLDAQEIELNSSEQIEEQARRELGMLKPGEKIFESNNP